MHFLPSRTAGLERLSAFVPQAGRDYASQRNYDRPGHENVSQLSPYLRHRLVTEAEVLSAVLGRHSLASAEKFVQEIYWRTYWKGWLEQRPSVWTAYRAGVKAALNRVQSEAGLRADFDAACLGETEIDCFNFWSQELVSTGYLHNHARMWFASIWIFTLRLPWELGADFFLRHLLDGDPASNTLGWRWVAGLQTRGKTYLARPANIAKYTDGRFDPAPHTLASSAIPLEGPPHPARSPLPQMPPHSPEARTGFLLTEEDLSPGYLFTTGTETTATALLNCTKYRSPLAVSQNVRDWVDAALSDCAMRYSDKFGPDPATFSGPDDIPQLVDWATAQQLHQIVTAYAPAGPTAEVLDQLAYRLRAKDIDLIRVPRRVDLEAWPHATSGFFKFKDKIPQLIKSL